MVVYLNKESVKSLAYDFGYDLAEQETLQLVDELDGEETTEENVIYIIEELIRKER